MTRRTGTSNNPITTRRAAKANLELSDPATNELPACAKIRRREEKGPARSKCKKPDTRPDARVPSTLRRKPTPGRPQPQRRAICRWATSDAYHVTPNEPSSATRPTRAFDGNRDAHAGFAAA